MSLPFEKYTLANGLRILVQKDPTTSIAAVNILYDVGSRDEDPEKTGFAHLFEHLMFGGSVNIPDFDGPLQLAGGENNAFTANDITNYYLSIPQNNIETAFWLESDRMLNLAFSESSLEVQRKVVVEEFRQRYLNQPYGDLWLLFRPLCYQVHPYRWATIGKEISHIENAVMDDVRAFYSRFYHPGNAILSIVSGLENDKVLKMAEKWFGGIPGGSFYKRELPKEPDQNAMRRQIVKRDVPFDILMMAYHMDDRKSPAYYAQDLISDLLSSGKSSRFYHHLIREKKLFTEISAYITGDADPGLFVLYGKVQKGVDINQAEEAVRMSLQEICDKEVSTEEMDKAVTRIEASRAFNDLSITERAYKLAYAEWLGDHRLVNEEIEFYKALRPPDIQRAALTMFKETNCSVLHYLSDKD